MPLGYKLELILLPGHRGEREEISWEVDGLVSVQLLQAKELQKGCIAGINSKLHCPI